MSFDPLRIMRIVLARKPWQLHNAGLRAQADRRRMAGDFLGAIPLYRQYLESRPDHGIAWMVYGHCLKETGQTALAEDAYAEGARQCQWDRAPVMAHAHFLKSLGRMDEARETFAGAAKMRGDDEALREKNAIPLPPPPPAADATTGSTSIWIDITDLLIFLEHNRFLSGIQRVQMALLDYWLQHHDDVCCVTTKSWEPHIRVVSAAALRDMHAVFLKDGGGTEPMRQAIHRLIVTSAKTEMVPGAILFVPGAFWIGGGNPPLLRAARSASMRIVPLIHDLIPLRRPEVCVPALTEEFTIALGEVLRELDGVIANSSHTASDVSQLMRRHAMPEVPVIAVPLAHQLNETVGPSTWTSQIEHLRDRPFVLTVGTIEPRKNHRLLLGVWQALVEEGLDPPVLIIAGKRGWMTDSFDVQMQLTREVGRRVKVLSDLSDPELNALYGGCLFTAFPSLAEGWGLPVGESLARGKVCVASNRDSMPEVGGDATLYIDAEDVAAAVPVFRKLLFEPGALEAAEHNLRERFQPRGWPEVVDDMMAALRRLPPARDPAARPGPLLPAGTIYYPAPHMRDERLNPLDLPLRMAIAEGWRRPSAEGAFMDGNAAQIHVTLAASGEIRIRLHADRALTVTIGQTCITLEKSVNCVVDVPVTAGPLSLQIRVEEVPNGEPPGLWLTGLSFHPGGASALMGA